MNATPEQIPPGNSTEPKPGDLSKFQSLPPEVAALIGGVQAIFQNIGEAMKAQSEAQAKAQITQSENLCKTQIHAEQQATERARIASTFLKPFFWCAFVLYGVAALMAFAALLKDQRDLCEKIIIGLFASLFSLLAGIGISKKQS